MEHTAIAEHVQAGLIHLELADTSPSLTSVRLDCDPAVPGPREFTRTETGWSLWLPRPPLDRIEYRLAIRRGADTSLELDPDNPHRVDTAFGQRSVLRLPGYAEPEWLHGPRVAGDYATTMVSGETVHEVPVTVWSPENLDPRQPAPLLLVHDGPEYDLLASITTFSANAIATARLPAHRVALAQPVDRDAWYSGSPRYLRTVTQAGLDAIDAEHPISGPVVVMGASLGGLTAVLAGLLGTARIGGVFAQSGSFFTDRHDSSERGFGYFDRISRMVRTVTDAAGPTHPDPLVVGMTCGALEENAANNRAMAAALSRHGHEVTYREGRDLHNYTAWRDMLDPDLTDVLRRCWPA